jgi:hypothetical protein
LGSCLRDRSDRHQVQAQITFDRPEGGMAPSLTLHQNGKDRPGKRVL